MAKAISGRKVITPKARLSYPALFKPDMSDMGKGNFVATLLFDEKNPDVVAGLKEMKMAVLEVARQKLGKDIKLSQFKNPFRKGNEKVGEDGKVKPGYADTTFCIVKSKYKPNVVLQDPKIAAEESDVYGGCYVRCSLQPYWYDNAGNKGVTFGLLNVQKVADGEPFGGGRSNPSDDFDSLEGGSEEETSFDDVDDDSDF